MIKGSMIFEKSEFFLDNLICRCYNKQQITEVHSYVVFCIQQNESASVNCQSRRLAQFVVRVIF